MTKHHNLLLIDDDVDDKDIFNSALRNVSPESILHYCASGPDAIKNLSNGTYSPHYIFLDLNMTPLNGVETLTEIKKLPGCADIPVIIYSTTITDNIISEISKLRPTDHFQKPNYQIELENYLKRILDL